jgi:hypothetical protein
MWFFLWASRVLYDGTDRMLPIESRPWQRRHSCEPSLLATRDPDYASVLHSKMSSTWPKVLVTGGGMREKNLL